MNDIKDMINALREIRVRASDLSTIPAMPGSDQEAWHSVAADLVAVERKIRALDK